MADDQGNIREEKIPKSAQEIINEIEGKYNKEKFSRNFYESNWYLNLAFYLGYQWVQYNYDYKMLTGISSPSWRIKHISNFVLPTIRIVKAKILKTEPTAHVIPRKKGVASKDNALLCTKVLKYLEGNLEMFNVLQRLYDSVLVLADGYLKPYYNPNAGHPKFYYDWQFEPNEAPMKNQETGVQLTTQDGRPLYHKLEEDGTKRIRVVHDGKIEIDVVTPDEIYVDPFAVEHKDLRWIMQVKTRTIKEVNDMYGVKLKEEHNPGLMPVGFDYQLGQLLGRKQDIKMTGVCLVKEYWEAPSDLYPNGRVVTIANDTLLQFIEIPPCYRQMEPPFPFIKFGYITVPKRYYSRSPLEDARQIQRRYNKVMSRLIEHIDLMSAGKWMVDTNSQIPKGYINGETGQVIRYLGRPGIREPHQAQMASIPNYVIIVLNMLKSDLQEVFGIHEVSHGKTPKGIRSGAAISALSEMDDTQLEPVSDNFRMGYSNTLLCLLYLVKYYWDEKKTISVVGKDSVEFIEDFLGSELDVDVDLITEIDSSLPDSKIYREQIIMERFEGGIITRDEARKALEIEGDDSVGKNMLDESKAELENEAMDKGITVTVDAIDNHLVHLQKHNEYQKTQSFNQLPNEIRTMHQTHVASHEEHIAKGIMTTDVKMALQEAMGNIMQRPKGRSPKGKK